MLVGWLNSAIVCPNRPVIVCHVFGMGSEWRAKDLTEGGIILLPAPRIVSSPKKCH